MCVCVFSLSVYVYVCACVPGHACGGVSTRVLLSNNSRAQCRSFMSHFFFFPALLNLPALLPLFCYVEKLARLISLHVTCDLQLHMWKEGLLISQTETGNHVCAGTDISSSSLSEAWPTVAVPQPVTTAPRSCDGTSGSGMKWQECVPVLAVQSTASVPS